MRRRSSKRKSRKRSQAKRSHAYEVAKARVKLSSRPLVGFWQLRGGTVLSLLLLAVLGLLASQFFITGKFYVYEAEIRGNQLIDANAIYAASGLHEISIFWIKPERVEAAISDVLDVKEVEVTCRLPNRVTIEVLECRPQVVWEKDGKRYGLDELGTVFPLKGEWEELLLIQDRTPGSLEVDGGEPGYRVDPEIIASALELQKLLPEATAFQYSDDKGLIFDQKGYPIYLGLGDMAEKVAIMNALLQKFVVQGVKPEFVDIRFKESPYYK